MEHLKEPLIDKELEDIQEFNAKTRRHLQKVDDSDTDHAGGSLVVR